jgi:hypothetical protein
MKQDPYQERMEKMRQKVDKTEKLEEQPLPSRREYHQKKKQRLSKPEVSTESGSAEENAQQEELKQSPGFPLLKSLLVFFILLPITVFFAYTYFSSHPKLLTSQKDKGVGVEISYDNHVGGNNPSEVASASPSKSDSHKKNIQASVKKSNESSKTMEKQIKPLKKPAAKLQPVKTTKPKSSSPSKTSGPSQGSTDTKNRVLYHQVKPKETLFSISMKYYHSQSGIATIEKWNNIGPSGIQSGQTLKIVISS